MKCLVTLLVLSCLLSPAAHAGGMNAGGGNDRCKSILDDTPVDKNQCKELVDRGGMPTGAQHDAKAIQDEITAAQDELD